MGTLDDALAYATMGWSIIPCHHIAQPLTAACSCGRLDCPNPGKHPRISWTQYEGDRPTEAELTGWLRRWPATNIGMVTGAISGVVALDVDPRHGGDETIRDLIAAHGPMPDTVRALTGGGGVHHLWEHPGGKISTEAGYSLGPGLDIRGDGGFVVLPPSLHASGRRYEWEVGCAPWDRNVEPMPPWLLALLRSGVRRVVSDTGKRPLDIESYLTGNATIPAGSRNMTLTRLAGHHIGRGEGEEFTVNALLNIYLPRCEPDERGQTISREEVIAIVHSITRAEARQRAAIEGVESGNAGAMGEDALIEAARGLWAGIGVTPISRFVLMRTAPDVVEYIIELPESEVALGGSLLNQNKIRDALLNSDIGFAPSRRKDERWTPLAVALRRCAIEVLNGPRRQVDQVSGWVLDWLQSTKRDWVEVEPGARREFLNEGPCLIDGVPSLRSQPFLDHLTKHRYSPALTMPGLTALLRQAGWVRQTVRTGTGSRDVVRFWAGPIGLFTSSDL